MNLRTGTTASTGLLVALLLASATLSAMSAPGAPAQDPAQDVERIRAARAASAEKALETQGGSRLLFKVDSAALREAVMTELRDDVVRIVREDRIPYAGLAMRDGSVEVRIADANNRQRLVSKLNPSTASAPSGGGAIDVADSGDGLIRLTPTDSGFA
jgi:preprotein translocase subunit SecD